MSSLQNPHHILQPVPLRYQQYDIVIHQIGSLVQK